MLKKTLAVFVAAAMLLPGSLVKAKPDPNPPDPPCSFHLATRDGRDTSSGYVSVSVVWEYRTPGVSSREVKPSSVTVYNYSGRSIKLVTDRWENSSGIVQRGIAGEIPYLSNRIWYPTTWFPTAQNPYVGVSAAATTRPGLGGSTKCRNY
ncbi:MAG: hypothetical protein ACYTX0_41845 [Nostoc sp.]